MAVDMYAQIEGIKGDSKDSKHVDWIEVLSFSHNIEQQTGGAASAQGSHAGGRADHDDLSFTKRLDSASPLLALYCSNGKHIPKIEFQLCRAMGEKTCFMKINLEDSIVSKWAPAGRADSADHIPLEEVGLRYGVIKWEYTPTDPRGGGKTGAAIKSNWSTIENKSA
jgi:type VI secretion system secreted protein Hcp